MRLGLLLKGCAVVCALVICASFALPAFAACPDGTVLVDTPTTLSQPKTVQDGSGGAYVVWLNTPLGTSNYQLFAQRVDQSGRVVSGWPAGGVQVTTKNVENDTYNMYNVCVDSNHRLVIVWSSKVGTVPKIFAQRISSAGTLEWGDGVRVFSTTTNDEYRPVIAADQIGGCFIAAEVRGSVTGLDVYVQRIDSGGTSWVSAAVACGATGDQSQLSIAHVGNTVAVIAWRDRRNSTYDIYAQAVASNGAVLWNPANGKSVTTAARDQHDPIVGRGTTIQEAYVIWSDERRGVSATADLYVARLNINGDLVWARAVFALTNWWTQPNAVFSANDGVTFTWQAWNGNANRWWVQAERLWEIDGSIKHGPVRIAGPGSLDPPNGIQKDVSTYGDGIGGFAMSWSDHRNGNFDVYATRYTADLVLPPGWIAQGNAMSLAAGDQIETGACFVNGGGLYVNWSYGGDVYEQATSASATIVTVPPKPTNVAASDCVAGGVTVTWNDVCGETEYHVYRNGTDIATVSQNVTAYLDPSDQPTSPPPGNYDYCVRSYRPSGGFGDPGCDTGCMPGPLQILSPNGGESWPPGSQQTIQWNGPSNPVTIQLFADVGVSTTLTTNATGGTYSFTVPDVATTRARVQISQVVNGVTQSVSSANTFTMAAAPPPNTWSNFPVDLANHGWNQSDMCADGSGGVQAVYLDYLGGSDLRFAWRISKTSPWAPTVAKSVGEVGSWPSIVRGSDGTVHIAYYQFTVGSANLYYTSGNPGVSDPSTWPQEPVLGIGVVQGDCSIALDQNNIPYIAFNTGNGGEKRLRVYKRVGPNSWANYGTWFNEDINMPHHITLKYAGNDQFWVACMDLQPSSRLNLWKYNTTGAQWTKLNVTNFVPGPYTDVSLTLDLQGNPHLAYTVPNNGGQKLIFHPWAQDGSGMGTPITVDQTLGTISSVSLQWSVSHQLPRLGYVGNGVVKQATGIPSQTQWPCDWTRQVVDASGNMDSQVSLVLQTNDEKWYLYRDLTTQSMRSAVPFVASGGGGGGGGCCAGGASAFPIEDQEASHPARVVVSGGLGSAPLQFRLEGARETQPLRVDIFDVQGRLIQTLKGRDTGELTWNRHDRMGQRVPSGVVFYRASAGRHAFKGKVVLTR